MATDVHLGYMERDPIRRDDSFEAFDEILTKAEQEQVRILDVQLCVDLVELILEILLVDSPGLLTTGFLFGSRL